MIKWLNFLQDEQKEEKNGHLILEEFLDAECGDDDDDNSAWEDVDEEEEDHAEGDDKHTCGKNYNCPKGFSEQETYHLQPCIVRTLHFCDKVQWVSQVTPRHPGNTCHN